MWKVYKYNGHYIQGDLISEHSSESAALNKAKKKINYSRVSFANMEIFCKKYLFRMKCGSFVAKIGEVICWLLPQVQPLFL